MTERSPKPRDVLARTIGSRARAVRTQMNLTQVDVAERIGLVGEVYGRLERGLMLPSVETLCKLATALGASADELLGVSEATEASVRQAPPVTVPPELRRFLRRVRALDPASLRLLMTIAGVLSRTARA